MIYSYMTDYLKVKYKRDRMHFIRTIMLENVDSLWRDKDFNC